MRLSNSVLKFLCIPIVIILPFTLYADWQVEFTPQRAFIENKGQFTLRLPAGDDDKVLYCYDLGATRIYFTRKGVSFSFTERKPYEEREEAEYRMFTSAEEWLEEERRERKGVITVDDVSYFWKDANENVEVIPGEQVQGYFSYSYYVGDSLKHVNFCNGYKSLTYRNLYPGIDVVYTIHPKEGIKYSLVVHPGANPRKVRMVYSRDVTLKNGEIHIPTRFGDIIDHFPVSFYASDSSHIIPSWFTHQANSVGFKLAPVSASETVIIDPWTQTPALTNPSGVWEVEVDGMGNVYAIGGGTPMRLVKYNAAGVFQWSYNTPYDTNNGDWLGALATDNAGNSYVTRGSTAAITKVNSAGTVLYSVNGGAFDEYWQIAFNCDQTKLLVGGTRLPLFPAGIYNSAMIFDINPNNGNVTNSVFVGKSRPGLLGTPVEVRAITSSYNARYYYLTHDTLGAIDQGLGTTCPDPEPILQVNHGYAFGYKCEDFRPNNGNGPISAIVADANFLYTTDGRVLHKRDLLSGAILATATIPGGIVTTDAFGFNVSGNSGLAMDDCGNVYAGSSDRVVKFDGNLNIISQTSVNFRVSDVEVSPAGEVIICGSTGTSSSPSRTGYIQSVALSPCNPVQLVCCDANICPAGPLCTTDPAITLTPSSPGGTFSGPGIVNPNTGLFDPAVAGPGQHTIVYTLPCGSDSIRIRVNLCNVPVEACRETNGDITASGGDGGPYTFQNPTYTQDCSNCFPPVPPIIPPCSQPPGCAVMVMSWTTFATGFTATPPPNVDTVRILDGSGNELIITDINNMQPCDTLCDASIIPPADFIFCLYDNPVTLQTVNPGGTWSGPGVDPVSGNFDPAAAGPGQQLITYTLPCGDVDSLYLTVMPALDATFAYSASSYCINDPDPTPTITGNAGGTFSISPPGVIDNATGTVDLDLTSPGTYVVSYVVTDSAGCMDEKFDTLQILTAADATITPVDTLCSNEDTLRLQAVDGGGTWSGNGIVDLLNGIFDPAVAGSGNHQIIYQIPGSCGDSDSITITVIAGDDASFSYSTGAYCLSDPDPVAVVTGTTGGVFSITPSGVVDPVNGTIDLSMTGPGTFTVTYATAGVCPDTSSVTVVIDSFFIATITPAGPFCTDDPPVTLTAASPGGIWTGNGITNASTGTFDPSVAGQGQHLITYTIGSSCGDTDSIVIEVQQADDASFSYSDSIFCVLAMDPVPVIQGTSGGVFTILPAGSINATTGQIDLDATGAGNYTVIYATSGQCADTQQFAIRIIPGYDATITPAGPFCVNEPAINLTAADPGGVWQGNGITDANNGTFDPSAAGQGSHTIIYTISGVCGDSDTITIDVFNSVDASFTYPATVFCLNDTNPVAQIAGTPGGVFTMDNNGVIDNATGEIDLPASGAGVFTVTYAVGNGSCADMQSLQITIDTVSDASITPAGPFCTGDTAVMLTAASPGGMWSGNGIVANVAGLFDPRVAGPGVHMVTYTISGNCGDSDTVFITVNQSPQVNISGTSPICEGDIAELSAVGSGSVFWSTGDTVGTISVAPSTTTTYSAAVSNSCGIAVDSFTVEVTVKPQAMIVPDSAMITSGSSITLSATGGTSYLWWPDDGLTCNDCQQTIAVPSETVTYCVEASNGNCTDTACAVVIVQPCSNLFIPTAFSPNGDGINDIFRILGDDCFESFHLEIYNRWGEKVFESFDIRDGWDGTYKGKRLPSDVFVYVLRVGKPNQVSEQFTGSLALLR